MSTAAENEELEVRALDKALLRRLLRFIKPYRWGLLLGGVLVMAIATAEQAKPQLIRHIIDGPVARGDVAGILPWAAVFFGLVAGIFILEAGFTIHSRALGQRLMLDLRMALFSHIHHQNLRFFDKSSVGRLMTRVIYDVETLNGFMTSGLQAVFQDMTTVLVITVMLFYNDWRLGLVAMSVLPIISFAMAIFRQRARTNYRAIRLNNSRMNAFLSENISGMSTVQLFNREEENRRRFDSINDETLGLWMRQLKIRSFFLPLAEVLSAVAVALVIWYGGLRHIAGDLQLGVLVAAIMYVRNFFQPIRDLSEKYDSYQSAMASSERIFDLLDQKIDMEDAPNAVQVPRPKGDLEFENIWFSYEKENWVLKDFSFKMKAGERIAVVGPTGAGKSTFLNVLFRFYPLAKGRVRLDGVDIATLNREAYRRHLGLVLQDPFLFTGSVLENVRMADETVSRERVEWACTQTGADAFIKLLPQTYDSLIAEGGSNLSTGQKQLLVFARALALDPAVLVLDEATASVDTATEIQIQKALETLLKGRSSITVAHRLSTITHADRILVIKDGRVAEEGSHQQLMAAGGLYKDLVELQFKEV